MVAVETSATGRWAGPMSRLARLTGASEPAAAPSLTLHTFGLLALFLVVWRLAILGFSMILERVGQVHCGSGVAVPWKYSACWDTQTYQIIAARGYDYTPGAPSSVAYFPLYPLLMRYADDLIAGPGDVLAGVVVGHLALLAACIYILQLVRIDFGLTVAWRSLVFLLVFPSAFFFSAAYPESLFLLGLAGSLYHTRRGQWVRAGLLGIVASATKFVGVLVVIPLGIELLAQRQDLRLWRSPRELAGIALAPLGAVGYFAWLQYRFGDWQAFFDAQRNWGRESLDPVYHLGFQWLFGSRELAERYYPYPSARFPEAFLLFDTTLLLVFIAAGVVVWRTVRPSYGALVLAMSLVLGLSGHPQSLNRYLVVLFPAFILLGRIRSEPIRGAMLILFTAGLAMETFLFVNGLWAG